MGNTFHKVYLQTVFAVKYRAAVIGPSWKSDLMGVLGNLINETGCKTLIVNGVSDHVHCLVSLRPAVSVSDLMKSVKAKSSKWINESGFLPHRFEWQVGYGVFSYSPSEVDRVYQYILNQERHHQYQTFREEYIDLLNAHGIEYDPAYLPEELV